jgi:integrase
MDYMRKEDTYYRDILTVEDITMILEAAVPYELEHLFLRLLARTGRRMGEIREVTPRDLDIKNKCLWTHIEKRRDKKSERRKIFLDETTLILLQQYISRNRIGLDERIFLASDATLKRWPQRFADKAGLGKAVSCHSFRHHLITHLVEEGWSFDQIQRITGHKSIASLTAYDHAGAGVVEDKFREVLAKI